MATLPELIETMEKHRVDSGPTLTLFGRRLREAGRLTKGKRGRGAAHMSYLDTARMVIACAATDHPERAADVEAVFSGLLLTDHYSGQGTKTGLELTSEHHSTLDLALAAMLEGIASGAIDKAAVEEAEERAEDRKLHRCMVHGRDPELLLERGGGWARLSLFGEGITWTFRHPVMAGIDEDLDGTGDIVERTTRRMEELDRETYRFRTGKNLIARMDARLLRDLASLIAGDSSE